MADNRSPNDNALDAFFDAAKANPPVPSDDLMARIMADAAAQAPQPAGVALPSHATDRPGVLAMFMSAIGGWKPAVGLAAAAVSGVMIGYVTPETFDAVAGGTFLSADDLVDDFLPNIDVFLNEG